MMQPIVRVRIYDNIMLKNVNKIICNKIELKILLMFYEIQQKVCNMNLLDHVQDTMMIPLTHDMYIDVRTIKECVKRDRIRERISIKDGMWRVSRLIKDENYMYPDVHNYYSRKEIEPLIIKQYEGFIKIVSNEIADVIEKELIRINYYSHLKNETIENVIVQRVKNQLALEQLAFMNDKDRTNMERVE